jgi:hypothetical protein
MTAINRALMSLRTQETTLPGRERSIFIAVIASLSAEYCESAERDARRVDQAW